MIGIQKGKLANWCNHNTDLLIITCGALIIAYVETIDGHLNFTPNSYYGFLIILLGVVTLSVGIAALICYRILLRLPGFF